MSKMREIDNQLYSWEFYISLSINPNVVVPEKNTYKKLANSARGQLLKLGIDPYDPIIKQRST